MTHDFLCFYIVVSKCEEWKEETFLWSAPGDSKHCSATAVEHSGGEMLPRAGRYYRAGLSVNLICAKKVCYSNRPKYFFFASTAESRATFLKLVLDRVSLDDEKLVTIYYLKFKVVLSFCTSKCMIF